MLAGGVRGSGVSGVSRGAVYPPCPFVPKKRRNEGVRKVKRVWKAVKNEGVRRVKRV